MCVWNYIHDSGKKCLLAGIAPYEEAQLGHKK